MIDDDGVYLLSPHESTVMTLTTVERHEDGFAVTGIVRNGDGPFGLPARALGVRRAQIKPRWVAYSRAGSLPEKGILVSMSHDGPDGSWRLSVQD